MNKLIMLLWFKSLSNVKYSYVYFMLFKFMLYMNDISVKIVNIIRPETSNKEIEKARVQTSEEIKEMPETLYEDPLVMNDQEIKEYNAWRDRQ